MKHKITVIGAGSWGLALANVLADNKHDVYVHSRSADIVNELNEKHTHKYLPGVELNPNIKATIDYSESLKECELVLIVIPSHAFRTVLKEIQPYIENKTITIGHASKGIENETLKTMSQVIEEELPHFKDNTFVLSGPSHAEEVSKRLPTTIVSSSKEKSVSHFVRELFTNDYFRVYTNEDVLGVEIGGSLKNIIALSVGISDGLGLGDNAKAALLTRGLAEITRLGISLGGSPSTFSGLAGIGDLIVTGTSKHSRNWKTGYLLSKGYSLDETLEMVGMVAEGVKTTKSAHFLAKKMNIETPITNELFEILFEGKHPKDATISLMTRTYKSELENKN